MKQFTFTIKDELGIHARPAGSLVKEAKNYSSKITINKADKEVDATKLMMLMSLGIKCGDAVTVKVEGEDEETAFTAIQKFFEENL
jgi:phosphocarrier protein